MRQFRMISFPMSAEGGNPAGVVIDPPAADDAALTAWAVRLNPLSETAFVERPDGPDAPYRVRYFAPGGEVDLCGHATAAAFAALAVSRLLPADGADLVAPGGRVRGRVAETSADGATVWMEMPVARRRRGGPPVALVAAALGLDPVRLAAAPPGAGTLGPALMDVGIPILLLPLDSPEPLPALRPDFDALRAISAEYDVLVFYPFALRPPDGAVVVQARSFAPAVDIDEDPATGTAVASLAAYLAEAGVLGDGVPLEVEQGVAMGHPSRVRGRVHVREDRPVSVEIGGRVVVRERVEDRPADAPGTGGGG